MQVQLFSWGRSCFLVVNVFLFLTGALMRNANADEDLPSLLRGLGSPNPSEIASTVAAIGARNDSAALPVLEALRDRRLRVDEAGALYIVSEDGTSVREAVSGAPATVEVSQLRSPIVSNVVRRTLLSVLG